MEGQKININLKYIIYIDTDDGKFYVKVQGYDKFEISEDYYNSLLIKLDMINNRYFKKKRIIFYEKIDGKFFIKYKHLNDKLPLTKNISYLLDGLSYMCKSDNQYINKNIAKHVLYIKKIEDKNYAKIRGVEKYLDVSGDMTNLKGFVEFENYYINKNYLNVKNINYCLIDENVKIFFNDLPVYTECTTSYFDKINKFEFVKIGNYIINSDKVSMIKDDIYYFSDGTKLEF